MGWAYHNKPPMGWPLDYDSGFVPDAAFWPMLGGGGAGIIQDLSGNGNAGTFVSDILWVPGKFGSALELDGTDDYIDCGTKDFIKHNAPLSVVTWINPHSMGGGNFGRILFRRNASAADNGLSLNLDGVTGTNRIQFFIDGTGSVGRKASDNAITLNTWQQLIVTFDGGTLGTGIHIYINEIEKTYVETTDGTPASILGQTTDIGRRSDGATRNYDGLIDHMIIYNRVLSVSERALLCQYPFWMFKDPDEIPVLDQYYTVGVGTILPQITSAYMRI